MNLYSLLKIDFESAGQFFGRETRENQNVTLYFNKKLGWPLAIS